MPDLDLVPLHVVLSLAGVVLSILAMQLSAHNKIGRDEKQCIRQLRRSALAVLAFGLCWGVAYGFERDWQPWPPFLVMIVGLDLLLLAGVIAAYRKPSSSVAPVSG